MALFRHVQPGQGFGQGSHAIQEVGMESVPRKGGAGQAPNYAPQTKGVVIRAMRDGFGMAHRSNLDLISRRRSRSPEMSTSGYAGSLASNRRNSDFPPIIRETSIDHSVHRRHTAPAQRGPDKSDNILVKIVTCNEQADRIGRNIKGRSRSPSPRSIHNSPTRQSSRSMTPIARGPRQRSCSRPQSPGSDMRRLTPPPFLRRGVLRQTSSPALLLGGRETFVNIVSGGGSCTWGEGHAFSDEPTCYSDSGRTDLTISAPLPEEQEETEYDNVEPLEEEASAAGDAIEVLADVFRMGMKGSWGSTKSVCSDGEIHEKVMITTPTTASGGISPHLCHSASMSSWPTQYNETGRFDSLDTMNSDTMTYRSIDMGYATSASNVMTFAKTVDKQFAKIYERRVKALVKEEQKRAMKRAC